MAKTLDLTGLPPKVADALIALADAYRREADAAPAAAPPAAEEASAADDHPARPFGWIKGWDLPESFFDPLPDDLQDVFGEKG